MGFKAGTFSGRDEPKARTPCLPALWQGYCILVYGTRVNVFIELDPPVHTEAKLSCVKRLL